MKYHAVLGIDCGVDRSAVAFWDQDRSETAVIPSAAGESTWPSVVALDEEGNIVVGLPALQQNGPAVAGIARPMGRDAQRVSLGGRDYQPLEITAIILKELQRQAGDFLGEPLRDAVIAVPWWFGAAQYAAMEDAAGIAQLKARELMTELGAASVFFGAGQVEDEQRHRYLVFDLGRSELVVWIFDTCRSQVCVLAAGGGRGLGGDDFNDRIAEWALEQIHERTFYQYGVDLRDDQGVRARLKERAEKCKCELSEANSAVLRLPCSPLAPDISLIIRRSFFNSLIEDLLRKSLDIVAEVIDRVDGWQRMSKQSVEQVLLLGGSSRIPRLRELLAGYFDHLQEGDIRWSGVRLEEAAARGAALVARKHTPPADLSGDGSSGPVL